MPQPAGAPDSVWQHVRSAQHGATRGPPFLAPLADASESAAAPALNKSLSGLCGWASRSCTSRRIRRSAARFFIQAQSYGNDAQTLESHVKNFLRQWKPVILDGPRRRQSRELRYLAICQRLRAACEGCWNRTLVAH